MDRSGRDELKMWFSIQFLFQTVQSDRYLKSAELSETYNYFHTIVL